MDMKRRGLLSLGLAAAMLGSVASKAEAQTMRIEAFAMRPDAGWRFFTDGVMGGVSTGEVVFVQEAGQTHARMTGRVSTANRGGFIQMRLNLTASPPAGTAGVRLVARGNDQRYFVHLRTTGTVLPWQFYQAGFDVTRRWAELRLPFTSFRASGGFLRATPRPGSLTSLAVAAYGRDHDAEIELREVGFY